MQITAVDDFQPGFYWWCCDGGELPLGHCDTAADAQQALDELLTLADGTEDWSGWRLERGGAGAGGPHLNKLSDGNTDWRPIG